MFILRWQKGLIALSFSWQTVCNTKISLVLAACISVLLSISSHAHEGMDNIVVQMPRDHQFQFAGFYAAEWQGYYQDENINVRLKPFKDKNSESLNGIDEVADGRAQFGIGSADVLIARDKGILLQIVSSVFQKSPVEILVRRSAAVASLADLTELKVWYGPEPQLSTTLSAMLRSEGIDPSQLKSSELSYKVAPFDLFAAGKIDAFAGYGFDARFRSSHENIRMVSFNPANYGVNFYGDSIYAAESYVRNNPELVERFLRATIKGWHYALSNRNEIVERIAIELPHFNAAPDLLANNKFQAKEIKKLLQYPKIPLGHTEVARWQELHQALKDNGLVTNDFERKVVYDQELISHLQLNRSRFIAMATGIGFLLLLCTTLVFLFLVRKNALKQREDYERRLRTHDEREQQLRLYETVFHNSNEAHLITDDKNHIIDVNDSYLGMVGYQREEVIGRSPKFVSNGHAKTDHQRAMWDQLDEKGVWQGEVWDRNKSGETFPQWASMFNVRNDKGEHIHYIASYTDISERKASAERIYQLSHNDMLTGLPNRFTLERKIERLIAEADSPQACAALMFIDMDRFKHINDSLGHRVGDNLIKEVARRLQKCVRNSDLVARSGGDDFIVLLADVSSTSYVGSVARMIVERLSEVYNVDKHLLYTSPSIGISFFPEDGNDAEVLMKAADTAMYRAKQAGGKQYKYFSAEMTESVAHSLLLEAGLQAAINDNQLRLVYQPQIAVRDGSIRGFEALIRWQHPQLGLIYPDDFIPAAEHNGLIHKLGRWQMNEACRQLKAWQNAGYQSNIIMSINISRHQLCSIRFVQEVTDAIVRYKISPSCLELEITETAAMDDAELAISHMCKLRDIGVSLAIDDFGTGYSSLAYLKRFPIHVLKLDREFVQDIQAGNADEAVVKGTLRLAHSMGLELIAEGVETTAQKDFLAAHNCDYIQGFLYGRPAEAIHWEPQLRQLDTIASAV